MKTRNLKTWNKKWKSCGGASFVLALVFLLVCSLAGASILTMAQAYGKRIDRERRKEAEYLAVMSAVEFVREQIQASNGLWENGLLEEQAENEVQKELLREVMEVCRAYGEHDTAGASCILKLSLGDRGNSDQGMEDMNVRLSLVIEETMEHTLEIGMPESKEKDAGAEVMESRVPVLMKAEFFPAERDACGGYCVNMTVRGTAVCETEESEAGHALSAVALQWDEPEVTKGGIKEP